MKEGRGEKEGGRKERERGRGRQRLREGRREKGHSHAKYTFMPKISWLSEENAWSMACNI